MSKILRNIPGLEIPNFPLELSKVGDLLYFEGSLMGVYSDANNSPYILDWVEANDHVNRWLAYKVEPEVLANYIFRNYTHSQIINNPTNNILFLIDKDIKGDIVLCKIISTKDIPYEYLPKNDVKFEEEDSKKLEYIKKKFNLDDIKLQINDDDIVFDILKEAKKSDSELINLHIKSKDSSKVGFGKIRSSILGAVLSNYNNLSEATAVNIFDIKGKLTNENKVRRHKGELNEIKTLGETEFVYVKAASFSVFLKPLKHRQGLFDNQTSSQSINQSIFDLFEASANAESLNKIKDSLDDSILLSYNNMLKEIKEQDITLSIQYANPSNDIKFEETFDAKKAIKILKNLDVLEIGKTETVRPKGTFKALDSLSSNFKFESLEGDIFEGKFSDQLKSGIFLFNLKDLYQTTIEIEEIKSSGKKNIKEKMTMVSCIVE